MFIERIRCGGDKALVTVKGRDLDGYYELSMFKVERPMDWTALEKAFADKSSVLGTVTAVVKGGGFRSALRARTEAKRNPRGSIPRNQSADYL